MAVFLALFSYRIDPFVQRASARLQARCGISVIRTAAKRSPVHSGDDNSLDSFGIANLMLLLYMQSSWPNQQRYGDPWCGLASNRGHSFGTSGSIAVPAWPQSRGRHALPSHATARAGFSMHAVACFPHVWGCTRSSARATPPDTLA
jgi:hypothetical protein